MNYNMKSTLANEDPIVTFIHQMIRAAPRFFEARRRPVLGALPRRAPGNGRPPTPPPAQRTTRTR